MNNKGLFSSKKFKYGSAATALTVLTVALIVLANVIFSALSSKFLWYADMTKSEIYTLSDATVEYLSGVDSEINIYFACEPDDYFSVSMFSDPMMLGVYPEALLQRAGHLLPRGFERDMDRIRQPLDFYAQNIYNGRVCRAI